MNKKKIMTIISILLIAIAVVAAVYAIISNKDCEKYSYEKCPIGCMVSSSGQNTEDIGCFSSDHEKGWNK